MFVWNDLDIVPKIDSLVHNMTLGNPKFSDSESDRKSKHSVKYCISTEYLSHLWITK